MGLLQAGDLLVVDDDWHHNEPHDPEELTQAQWTDIDNAINPPVMANSTFINPTLINATVPEWVHPITFVPDPAPHIPIPLQPPGTTHLEFNTHTNTWIWL